LISARPEQGQTWMVKALFVSTCLLSIVSWYTTQQGMALYLSPWFAFLASLGVQSALVLVAWLIGFTKSGRALLVAVYAITATVSVGFSYVSLYTWFAAKERPAIVERQLYDTLNGAAGQTSELLASAVAEARKHTLALEEMTSAEKSHGFISKAADTDPYLAKVREAVAKEAGTYAEGSGAGVRYTAFERYAKLARQSLDQLTAAQSSLSTFRSQLKSNESSEAQIRKFREVYDGVPWSEVSEQLHAKFERPGVPTLAGNLDHTATGQEDLLLAFTELVTAPTARHLFSFVLAAFIDLIVFLLAFASGPYLNGEPEQRWCAASAALDGAENQVFIRDLLRKCEPDSRGMARAAVSGLSAGELQLCLLLAAKGEATLMEEGGRKYYLFSEGVHERLVEALAIRGMPLRAAAV